MKSLFLALCPSRLVAGWAAFLIIGVASLAAQVPAAGGKIHFSTVGWKVAPDDLYYESEGKAVKIAIYDSSRSAAKALAKVPTMTFFRWVTDAEGKQVREEVATVDIKAAGPRPLLVFMPAPESPKRYRVVAVADDLNAFPLPSCRFINLTAADLYIKFGDQELKLTPKTVAVLDPNLKNPTTPEARYTMVYVMVEQGPQRVYSNNWAVRPTERTLVFMFPEDNTLKVMRIVDSGI